MSDTASYQHFQEGFARWYVVRRLRTTGRTTSPHTLRSKAVHLATACRMMGCKDEVSLGNLLGERSELETLLDRLGSRMTPGALRVAVYALKDFGEYAEAMGWVKTTTLSPTDIPPKNPPPAITCYTPDEMETFVSAARGRDLRWWAFLTFLVDTGRRVGETLDLRWEWFRLTADPAYVELPTTKNGDPQYVPLSARLVSEVFTSGNVGDLRVVGGRHWSRNPEEHPFPWRYTTVYDRFARFCQTTGLPNRGFHNFRHTVITDRIARGVPLQAVAALAGHRSIATTDQRYNHANALAYARFVER